MQFYCAQAGVCIIPYLNDFLIVAPTLETCLMHTKIALNILQDLGLLVNEPKSRMIPAQAFEWLGIFWDLRSHKAQVTQKKEETFQDALKSLIKAPSCTRRSVMKLQGLANWIGQCDPIIRLVMAVTRRILRRQAWLHPDDLIHIPRNLKLNLCKWISLAPFPQLLGSPAVDITIQTDASLKGWGFLIGNKQFHGTFDRNMTYSINVLELLTIWFALLMVSKKGIVIQILCDNSVALQVLKKGGSKRFHLSSLVELIWKRAAKFGWTLCMAHIQGSFNVIADQLSRKSALSTEWSLQTQDFRRILQLEPRLQVDLFATHLNAQLETFVSPCPDESAVAVDALTISWDKWDHLYLYPPTPMISKVLAKLAHCCFVSAILLTPEMPLRPWFMALSMHKIPSTRLTVQLQQVVVDEVVNHPQITKLRAWNLSGRHTIPGFQTADR